jgi:hypothetical protein
LYIANITMFIMPSMLVDSLWIPLVVNLFFVIIVWLLTLYCILSTELNLDKYWKYISGIIVGIVVYTVNIT